jgi:hypothetical protein
MTVKVIEDAEVLIPNQQHQNFTAGSEVIKKDTIIQGKPVLVKGKRKGQGFTYKLFKTNNNQFIYFKKIEPMERTEVSLGADDSQTPTVVNVPVKKKLFTKNVVIYTLIGAGLGYGFSKYKKYTTKKTLMVSSILAVVGFGIGTYVDKQKSVKVTPSK